MSLSDRGALKNAAANALKLEFAKESLSDEQFERLHKSYKQLFWFQIAPVILLAIAAIAVLIFVPSQDMPIGSTDSKFEILVFGAGLFMAPFYPIWLIISQFVVGKLWHKYSKWCRKGGSIDELYDLFK